MSENEVQVATEVELKPCPCCSEPVSVTRDVERSSCSLTRYEVECINPNCGFEKRVVNVPSSESFLSQWNRLREELLTAALRGQAKEAPSARDNGPYWVHKDLAACPHCEGPVTCSETWPKKDVPVYCVICDDVRCGWQGWSAGTASCDEVPERWAAARRCLREAVEKVDKITRASGQAAKPHDNGSKTEVAMSADEYARKEKDEKVVIERLEPGAQVIRLNLGSGTDPERQIEGFIAIDRKLGTEVYPLEGVEDGTVDEIRASHVLEHFGHGEAGKVLKHWIDKLRLGGCLRLAVPDLKWCAETYLSGKPINVQGYLMGGQIDANDHHGSLYDKELLTEVMAQLGLDRIRPWVSEIKDCATLECSLNLMGYKRDPDPEKIRKAGIWAVMGAPRFGPILHSKVATKAFHELGIPCHTIQGCFWAQNISKCIEDVLARGCKYVLTLDYDTIFSGADIRELHRLMETYPDVDAIMPVQSKRCDERALFGMFEAGGDPVKVYSTVFERDVTKCTTGHFGLTLFRADKLREFPKPWMVSEPGPDGSWREGHVDADIAFWHKWGKQGNSLYMGNKVIVGHQEEVVTWPGKDFKPVRQSIDQYCNSGMPQEVIR